MPAGKKRRHEIKRYFTNETISVHTNQLKWGFYLVWFSINKNTYHSLLNLGFTFATSSNQNVTFYSFVSTDFFSHVDISNKLLRLFLLSVSDCLGDSYLHLINCITRGRYALPSGPVLACLLFSVCAWGALFVWHTKSRKKTGSQRFHQKYKKQVHPGLMMSLHQTLKHIYIITEGFHFG